MLINNAVCVSIYLNNNKKYQTEQKRETEEINTKEIYSKILKERENGKEICDILRDSWNSFFNSRIDYTDFDSLREGFQAKFFGIPIGKN